MFRYWLNTNPGIKSTILTAPLEFSNYYLEF